MADLKQFQDNIRQKKDKDNNTKLIVGLVVGVLLIVVIGASFSSPSTNTTPGIAPKATPETTNLEPAIEPKATNSPSSETYQQSYLAYQRFKVQDDKAKAELDPAVARPLKLGLLGELSRIIGCDIDDGDFVGLEAVFEDNDPEHFEFLIEFIVCD